MCREHVVDVRSDYARFQAAGGEVVVVTMGNPKQTAAFRNRFQLPFPCLSDPQQVAYKAYGVPRGTLGQVAGPAIWKSGLSAVLRAGIGVPQGDPFQMQSAFVVDRTGLIRFASRPQHSADHPSNDELINAIRECN